jgi:hypothetical protein
MMRTTAALAAVLVAGVTVATPAAAHPSPLLGALIA